MIEKIKKLLDSGCWVRIDYTIENKLVSILTIYRYNDTHFISDSGLYKFEYLINEKISIKPIARPLYQYKVGDRVVVLDNYEGKYLIFGEIVEITNIWNGTIEVEKNKDIYSIDIRCIAPVLD